jgi:hypothetical protein
MVGSKFSTSGIELRIVVRYQTSNVPTLPSDRAQRVFGDFASFRLHRPFSWDKDFIHFSSDFDSDITKPVWVMCDFNIRGRLSKVEDIPLECWDVYYSEQMEPYGTLAQMLGKLLTSSTESSNPARRICAASLAYIRGEAVTMNGNTERKDWTLPCPSSGEKLSLAALTKGDSTAIDIGNR